jgi:hypothetical protein
MYVYYRVADPDPGPHCFGNLVPDPHYFGNLDPDPHYFGSLDPDPHYFGNLDPDQNYFGNLDPDPHLHLSEKAGSGSALKSKFRSFKDSKYSRGGPWTFTIEA